MQRRTTLIVLAIVVVLAGAAIVQQWVTAQTNALPTETAPKIGYLAPEFSLETMDGKTAGITRGELEKPVIINFWASWCNPCRLEAPLLADTYDKYEDQLMIYGINGTEFDQMDSAKAFVEQYQLRYPILMDKESAVFKKYQVAGFPTTFFVDRHGVIRDIVIGLPLDHEEFERKIKKLIQM